jgi:hypothetical protein
MIQMVSGFSRDVKANVGKRKVPYLLQFPTREQSLMFHAVSSFSSILLPISKIHQMEGCLNKALSMTAYNKNAVLTQTACPKLIQRTTKT